MELTKPTPDPEPTPKTVNDVSPAVPAAAPANGLTDDLAVHEQDGPATTASSSVDTTDEPAADKPGKPAKPPKAAKPASHGSGGAVFAAVVIILGLGAMFTYAYLRSQNISLF